MHSVMECLFFLYTRAGTGIFKLTSRSSLGFRLFEKVISDCV